MEEEKTKETIFQKKISVLHVLVIMVITIFATVTVRKGIERENSFPMELNHNLSVERKTELLQLFAQDAAQYLHNHPDGRVIINNK